MFKTPNKAPTKRERRNQKREEKKQRTSQEKFGHERKYNVEFVGKTANQKSYIRAMYERDLVVAKGYAGTGKTLLATAFACRGLVERKFEQVVISRPNIPTGRSLGYFPGDISDKLKPWLAQILSYMTGFVNQNVLELWLRPGREKLLMVPLETMRGRSFSDCCVIIDEAQNLTAEEIVCVTTRIGENSKLLMCGDERQSDLHRSNDFKLFCDLLMKEQVNGTEVIDFGIEDCLRSKLTRDLLEVYTKNDLI